MKAEFRNLNPAPYTRGLSKHAVASDPVKSLVVTQYDRQTCYVNHLLFQVDLKKIIIIFVLDRNPETNHIKLNFLARYIDEFCLTCQFSDPSLILLVPRLDFSSRLFRKQFYLISLSIPSYGCWIALTLPVCRWKNCFSVTRKAIIP